MVLDISSLLEQFESGEAERAWSTFLDAYSPLIYLIVREFDSDEDRMADGYLFVCEHLCHDDFRRLREFRRDEGVKFSTWLRVIVRNLCTDWLRHRFGRPRAFRSVARRPALDQDVFRALFQDGLTIAEAAATLCQTYPHLTTSRVSDIADDLHRSLTPRQRWLLSSRKTLVASLSDPLAPNGPTLGSRVAHPDPDPESQARESEAQTRLIGALANLEPSDRLILRWRFEQELTLEQIARLAGLSSPQAAARRLEAALARIRRQMSGDQG